MKSESTSQSNLPQESSRRTFLKQAGKVAAVSALATLAAPPVYAGEDNTIRLALIGCGGRGSGAVKNALSVPNSGPVTLYAMADLREDKMRISHKALSKMFGNRVDVPAERKFLGFDAYKKAIDILRPGDVAMLTGYAGWRPTQLAYAVKKGINVFMEKSFATDPVGVRKVIEAGQEAKKKNLKIAAGLMCRHSVNRQELIKRIRNGELGDILLSRAYRMQPIGGFRRRTPDDSELMYQIKNFTKFLWVSGGLYAEMDIHQIDELCWLKGENPVTAHGVGGRMAGSTDKSQNLDSFSAEWTFADGTKAYDVVRYAHGCHNEFATYVHGTKASAQFSGNIHKGTVKIFKDQRIDKSNIAWEAPAEEFTPWQAEWNVMIDAIRKDKVHNEAIRAAETNLTDIMGRAAIHSGQTITWDEAMASKFEHCPGIETMNYDTIPPIKPNADGQYPVPVPGIWKGI